MTMRKYPLYSTRLFPPHTAIMGHPTWEATAAPRRGKVTGRSASCPASPPAKSVRTLSGGRPHRAVLTAHPASPIRVPTPRRLRCALPRFCSSMDSPQRLQQISSGNVLSGRIAPPCWLSDLWTLWWQPFIRFHQGGTAMGHKHTITAWAQLLFSSPCPAIDNLKPKRQPPSRVSLNS